MTNAQVGRDLVDFGAKVGRGPGTPSTMCADSALPTSAMDPAPYNTPTPPN